MTTAFQPANDSIHRAGDVRELALNCQRDLLVGGIDDAQHLERPQRVNAGRGGILRFG
jgi:hypothetical protein